MLKTLAATVALCALGAGCAHPRIHVIGDRPAEVYVKTEKGTITEEIKERLDLGPTSHYVGRTTPGGDDRVARGPTGASSEQREYSFFYEVPKHPARVEVQIKSAERTWEYLIDFTRDRETTLYYPKIGESAPPATEPGAAPPQPAGLPKPPVMR